VGLLQQLGYSNVRHLYGGIADWKEAGLPIESVPADITANVSAPEPLRRATIRTSTRTSTLSPRRLSDAMFDLVERLSIGRLFIVWLALILVCGVLYWLSALVGYPGLTEAGKSVTGDIDGVWTAIYFSFVTATSVGYGDVLPVGAARILAVAEAVGGLLIFGLLVAKFVSYRQDMLVRQIHTVTFEEQLHRVQTNLHLVVSELLTIGAAHDEGAARPYRIGPRLESTALIFAGELRAIHHLLYEPEQAPDETGLNAILANLSSALTIMREVLLGLPTNIARSATLDDTLQTVSLLAQEICADCVPQEYTPALKILMDRIQQTARTIA
jgi:hypothetical protein